MLNPVTDPLDALLQAWLSDENAPTVADAKEGDPGHPHDVALAYKATQAAIEEAATHQECPLDPRIQPVLVELVGTDRTLTVQSIPVGANLNCVIGNLARDPSITHIRVLGYEPPGRQVTEPKAPAPPSPKPDFTVIATGPRTPGPKSQSTTGGLKRLRPNRRFRWPWRRAA